MNRIGIFFICSNGEIIANHIPYKKGTFNLPAMSMKSLSYNGENHIKNLLPKYLGAEDTALNAWIMKHVLVGMVKRVFNPGCKFDELMVLTGIQGVGKTSFIEKLALLPEWYCSLNNIKGKDAVSNLVGKIVVELEEFVTLRNAKSARKRSCLYRQGQAQ